MLPVGGRQRSRPSLGSPADAPCLATCHLDNLSLGFDGIEDQVLIDRLQTTSPQSGHGLPVFTERDPWPAKVCKPNRPAFAIWPVDEHAGMSRGS